MRAQTVQPAFRGTGRLQRAGGVPTPCGAARTDDPLALIQYLDLKTYLVGDINTKVDRASMAHSLEVREPLMDHKLVEWLATLPSS
jgi:asparagine synthase (glutamine-hydrolysing)